MKTNLTIVPIKEGYDLLWYHFSTAIRWDDPGWIMETWRDGRVIDLISINLADPNAYRSAVDWNAVMRRVEELAK